VIRPDPLVLHDEEDPRVPPAVESLGVVDAHVHLFPDRVFESIRAWFEKNAWPIRYACVSERVLEFLGSRGIAKVVALHYAHKPGLAAGFNDYVLDLARRHPMVVPTATVFPGEAGDREILRRAIGEGARGIKVHCHVQKIAPADPRLETVWEEAERAGVPVVIHAGREPSSDAYGVDTRALCSADQVDAVLARHPALTLVVPHLGADEFDEYFALLDRHPRLFLDTTMSVAGYFPGSVDPLALAPHADRILYGTDFPGLPFAWDRELKRLVARLPQEALRPILSANALRLFGS
jgi:predicted TIM-barrel fold metal-dependent hydrolase